MIKALAILVLTVLLTGCAGFVATPTPTSGPGALLTATPTPTYAPTHGPTEVASTATPTPTLVATPTPTLAEELSFFEEELSGLWSRYHSYDDSRQYVRFNDDGQLASGSKTVGAAGERRRASILTGK